MVTWNEFAASEPEFSRRVQDRFAAHAHHTMATLRRDGSPRISGTEVRFSVDGLTLDMMGGARRAADLRRDPRVALHSCTDDPGEDPTLSPGDAKLSGVAIEVEQPDATVSSHEFRIDPHEVVITRVGSPADHLIIETWHPGHLVRRIERR